MHTNPTSTYDGIHYEILENEIHVIRVLETNRQAMNNFFSLMESMYFVKSAYGVVAVLIDASAVSLPMAAAMRMSTTLEKKYPTHIPIHVALLQQHALTNILQPMLRSLALQNKPGLFNPGQHDEAIRWLLTKRAEIQRKQAPPATPVS